MIHDIFKIGVYRIPLYIDNDYLEKSAAELKNKNQSVNRSNRGGFHSTNLNFKNYEELSEKILEHGNIYAKELNYPEVAHDNIWCNINTKGDHNVIHSHPNTRISGVYYVKTPENCGNIIFYSPAFHVLLQSNLYTDNEYSALTWHMPAIKGMLYLFPSWLLHTVQPNMSEEERISFAFNLM